MKGDKIMGTGVNQISFNTDVTTKTDSINNDNSTNIEKFKKLKQQKEKNQELFNKYRKYYEEFKANLRKLELNRLKEAEKALEEKKTLLDKQRYANMDTSDLLIELEICKEAKLYNLVELIYAELKKRNK